jgi:deoxycytidylate deaminase
MSYDKHIRYLKLAEAVSKFSDYKPYKIGCVLVYKKQILSVGHNTNKSHPIQKEYNSFRNLYGSNINHKAHAEVICVSRAMKLGVDLSNCTLYIFRQHKDKTWAMARPCAGCMEFIKDQKISTIVFTNINNNYSIEYL